MTNPLKNRVLTNRGWETLKDKPKTAVEAQDEMLQENARLRDENAKLKKELREINEIWEKRRHLAYNKEVDKRQALEKDVRVLRQAEDREKKRAKDLESEKEQLMSMLEAQKNQGKSPAPKKVKKKVTKKA